MAHPVGIKAKAAFKKDRGLYGAGPDISYPETPGGTSLAATHKIPFSAETIVLNTERQDDPALVGSGIALPSDRTGRFPMGPVEGRLRYRGWERMMLCAMGFENATTAGTPGGSPETVVTGAYRHILEQDKDLQDEGWMAGERTGGSANDRKIRRGMFGLEKQVTEWVWYSVMMDKMTISGTPQGVDVSFDLVGYDLVRGSYNHANWTLPAGSQASALFQHAVVKLGARSAGVGSMFTERINAFELTVENVLKGDDQSSGSGENIEIPVRGDHRKTSLKLDYPRYFSDTNQLYQDADQELLASIEFTGPIITGATPYELAFYFGSCRVDPDSVPVASPGPLKESIELECHRPGTNLFQAAKFPNITLLQDSELVIMAVNPDNFNYLNEN